MATTDIPAFEGVPNPTRPFAVAAWFGMSQEEIMAGLKDGTILPPPGAPPDWVPPGFVTATGSAAGSDTPPTTEKTTADQGAYVDMAKVQGWFRALDSTMTDSMFQSVWKRAGADDAARGANLTAYLARALLGETVGNVAKLDSTGVPASNTISAALTAFTGDPSHHAQLVDLADMDGAQLAKLAQTDIGYRYALKQLDTLALTGNRALFATANADSGLDRFDPDTGETQLSDSWLADRSKFLAWKMAADNGASLSIDGAQNWSFIDRAQKGTDGQPLTVKLVGQDEHGSLNQVIFGDASSESIKGQAGTDRIYGGNGDDVLRGAGGADHLEGGHGDDLEFGGTGNDELVGNQGDDDLDGGRGADSLDGGSGDDTLTGGRGDDHLAGGDGADTYVIDGGDGTDAIIDSDGHGAISLDDEVVTGGTKGSGDMWTSADGRLDFSLDGDLSDEGTLTISAFSPDAKHSGTPDNVIHVSHWHNGDLGITLGGDGSTGQPDGTQDPGARDSGANPVADETTTGPDDTAATDTTIDAPATHAPPLDEQQPRDQLDINAALDQLLEAPTSSITAIDPAQLQNAVAAFSGVLVPPDVSASTFGGNLGSNAVSIADITGALADDMGSDDLGHEAAGSVVLPPEWHRPDDVALSVDGSGRGMGNGMVGARR
jgi:RTX calcium-binding nonapeptide repeat (4 copies)